MASSPVFFGLSVRTQGASITNGENRAFFVLKRLTEGPGSRVSNSIRTFRPVKQELKMNDLIVYAGIGLLLVGLPVLFARWNTTK
jgi:hypothetical protein